MKLKGQGSLAASGAILGALASFWCCLPLGFLGALGAAGVSLFFATLGPWFLGLSAISLVFGFVQYFLGAKCGLKQSRGAIILLWAATFVVISIGLFPQSVAGFLADWFLKGNQ